VLRQLEVGPTAVHSLARTCAIRERGARVLLGALVGLGLAEVMPDGRYRAGAPGVLRLAAPSGPWASVAEVVRSGRPQVAADTTDGAGAFYPEVVQHLAELLNGPAEGLAAHLSAPGQRVLDVGAGAVPWSLALARLDATCSVTAVDLPSVLPVTRAAVRAAGREAQFEFLGGDLFTIQWERARYDLAIVANVCHLFDEGANRRLLARLLPALRPGGRLAIVDILPNERLDGPRAVLLYALGLLLRTEAGEVHPFSAYVDWLRASGYERVERRELSVQPPVSLVIARRPAVEPG
jgi:SAM-dependent methyltransferase